LPLWLEVGLLGSCTHLAAIGFLPLLLLKNRPEEVNLPAIEIYEQHGEFAGMTVEQIKAKIKPKKEKEEHAGFAFTLKQTVGNKRVWAVSWAFFFVDIIRYGFLLWAPTYMFEIQKAAIDKTAYKVIAIPLFGIAGAIFSGWASDRFFQSRRAPIAALLMGYWDLWPSSSTMAFLKMPGFWVS